MIEKPHFEGRGFQFKVSQSQAGEAGGGYEAKEESRCERYLLIFKRWEESNPNINMPKE
jgi:hypothetical protein